MCARLVWVIAVGMEIETKCSAARCALTSLKLTGDLMKLASLAFKRFAPQLV